jgi:hypothetical protein
MGVERNMRRRAFAVSAALAAAGSGCIVDAVEEDGAPAFGVLRDGGASGVAAARDAGRADAELTDVGLDAEPVTAWDAAPLRVADAARVSRDSAPGWDAFVTAPGVDALVLDDALEAHIAVVHRPCRAAEPVVLDACATRGGSTPYRFEWAPRPAAGASPNECRVPARLGATDDVVRVRVVDVVGRTSTASARVVERAGEHDGASCVVTDFAELEAGRWVVEAGWRTDVCEPGDPLSEGFALRVNGRTFEVPPGGMEELEPGVFRFGEIRAQPPGPVALWGDPVEAFAWEDGPDGDLPADPARPCEPERLDVRINGIQLPSVVGQPVERGVCARSALALVDALNAISGETGVRAEAGETIRAGNAPISGGTLDAVSHIVINGETITGVVVQPDDADGRLLDAVNALQARTGVRAALDAAGAVQLHGPGLNIDLVINGVAGTNTGMGADSSADLTTAPLRLFSDAPLRVEVDADLIGFAPGWYDADGRTDLTQWSATVRPLDGRLSVEAVGAFEPGAPPVEWVLGGEPWRACEDPEAP